MVLNGFPTYEEMFLYVKNTLEENGGEIKEKYWLTFRKRSEHTRRTCLWLSRLLDEPADLKEVDEYSLMTAAIFHDSGYRMENNRVSKTDHGLAGAEVFKAYAEGKAFREDQVEKICRWIAVHSDKKLLRDPASPPELVLLLEADLLDEEGALAVVCDCVAQGMLGARDYKDATERLSKYSASILNSNPMITPKAVRFWEQKQRLIAHFLTELENDLGYPVRDGLSGSRG